MALKRGYFFTLDALLASGILLGALILFSSFGQTVRPITQLNYVSSDLLSTLTDLQMNELNSTAYTIIANVSTTVNTNQSVLGVVGELWANGDIFIARDLAEFIIDDQVPKVYGVGVWMDDEQIFARTSPSPTRRASSRKIVSGLTKAKPVKGFISRANAQDLTRRTSRIISFSPMGSGWYGSNNNPGKALIDKYFTVPSNTTLLNASLAISLHMHTGSSDWTVVDINSGNCTFTRNEIANIGQGYYDIKNVTSCINSGINRIHLELRNINYNGHIHPGMLLKLDFLETTAVPLYDTDVSERYYFDNIVVEEGSSSAAGVWQTLPFHIPEDAVNVSAFLQVVGNNIDDYNGGGWFSSWSGWRRRRDYDYIMFFNDDAPFDSDKHPSPSETYTYNLDSELVTGTNVAVVYFNNYGDSRWGDDGVEIYSDQYNDPDGSSFVEVNYSISSTLPYGHIELTDVKEAGGSEDDQKTVDFSFPPNSMMSDVFGHVAQRFSYLVLVEADDYSPPTTDVFDSPASRAVPTDIFIPKTTLSGSPTATNYVEFTDRNRNDILPQTSVEYRFYLPSFVGYGAVFATQEDAVNDAIARLEALLDPYISAGNIEVESSSITDVPSLWGPTIAEVRVWR